MLNRILLVLVTAIALGLTACGDDEESGPTKAEFIEEADAICREGEEKVEEIARAGFADPSNPTGDEVLAILEEAVPIQRDVIDQVRELDKPEGDEDEIDEFLTLADEATDKVEEIRDPQAAIAAIQAADSPQDPYYEADQAAQEYGLEVCGE